MKINIRHILATFAALAALVSCSKDECPVGSLRVSATIASGTRLEYAVSDEVLAPSWKVGDKVFGYDDKGGNFTFTVSAVSEGKATMDVGGYEPSGAKVLYAVYYPGKSVSDIKDELIGIDLSSQTGVLDETFPLIMTSTGRIHGNAISFSFATGSSVLAIRQMKVKAGEKLTSVKVLGVTTVGEVSSVHGMMDVLKSSEKGTVSVATNLTADADGVVNIPLYVSVLPAEASHIGIVAVAQNGTEYAMTNLIGETDIEAGNYYYVSKIMGESVAEIVETGEKFATIHNAFQRANESPVPVKIRLTGSVSVTDSIILKNETNQPVTVDFNGCTVTGSLKQAPILRIKSDVVLEDTSAEGNGGMTNAYANVNSRAIYMLYDKTSVTINGGVYKSKADDGVAYFRGISSKIVVNGGKFINERSAGGEAFYVYGSTGIGATINGGSFIDVNGGTAQAIRSGNGAQIVINGGYFHNGNSTGAVLGQATSTGFVGNVSGGYFSKEINSTYIAEGHAGSAASVIYDGRTYSYKVE